MSSSWIGMVRQLGGPMVWIGPDPLALVPPWGVLFGEIDQHKEEDGIAAIDHGGFPDHVRLACGTNAVLPASRRPS